MNRSGKSTSEESNIESLLGQISRESLTGNLWQLVTVPSPTGKERKASLQFAEMLESAGAAVNIDESIPDSPSVIGRLNGQRKGHILQLAGHIDHVDIPHDKPKLDTDIISGRGAADMKNGLAGMLEIVRLLKKNGCNFPGEILVTVYGLHEAPEGGSHGISSLIDKGIKGDAAIVFEGPDDAAAIMANGMSIWNLDIRHEHPACHELCIKNDRSDLLEFVAQVIDRLRRKDRKLLNNPNPFPLLGPESLFIGQVHYGDFYNRVPGNAFLQGTRRWHPDKSFEQVKQDFDMLIESLPSDKQIRIDRNWIYVGDSYKISEAESIVKSLISAFETVHNKTCPVRGHNSVTDANILDRRAKIPAVLCGFGTETGHADYEFVTVEKLERSCAVALQTVMNYLNSA